MKTDDVAETARKFDYLWASEYWSKAELYSRFSAAMLENFDCSPSGLAKTIFTLEEHYDQFSSTIKTNPDYRS